MPFEYKKFRNVAVGRNDDAFLRLIGAAGSRAALPARINACPDTNHHQQAGIAKGSLRLRHSQRAE
jgi:hypothetical protein